MVLCTVAIPVYNRQDLVVQAIESALVQNVADLEILVVDNCSTDQTWERLRKLKNERLRLLQNPTNLGLFGNFNRCLELARGKYLRFLCSDDRLVADCLAGEIDLMESYPNVALLSTRGWLTDEALKHTKVFGDYLHPGIYRGADMIGASFWLLVNYGSLFNFPSGILLRREAAMRAGRFDAGLHHLGDLDYWLKVLTCGDLAISDTFGCEVRVHQEMESHALLVNGNFTEEWFLLAKRWEDQLRQENLYEHVIQQTGATSVRIALHFWRRGRPDIARLYWKTARDHVPSRWNLLVSCARLFWLTVLARACKIRFLPKNIRAPQIAFS